MQQRRHLFRALGVALLGYSASVLGGAGRAAAQAPAGPWIRGVRLNVVDLERSIAFYRDVVGLKLLTRHEEGSLSQAVLNPSGMTWRREAQLVLAQDKARTAPIARDAIGWMSFHVADVDAVLAKARASGRKVTRGPNHDPNAPRYYVYVEDPDGYSVELLHLSNLDAV